MRATHPASLTVQVPLSIRRRPGRKMVVTPEGMAGSPVHSAAAVPTRGDPALVKALARAFRYQKLLDEGHYASISDMAAGEKIERGYLGSLLRLTLLAPDLVELILDGRAADRVTLPALLGPVPPVWAHQREHLMFDKPVQRARLEAARQA
ncbi:hypothetical protein ACFQX4_17115 [Roseomonas sp. GCM10028921]